MTLPLDNRNNHQFLRLFAENEPVLRVFVRLMVPRREDSSEVMQELAVVLWEKYDSAQDFRKWAFGVARNVALRHLQKLARDRHIFDDELVNQFAVEVGSLQKSHETQREALDDCLKKLPIGQRELVLAAYTKGTRIDELAVQRGQTAMSLYKMLHRIRKTLLSCVQRGMSRENFA